MLNEEFKKKLPLDDFSKLGLFEDGNVKVSQSNLLELLAGRRTDFIELKNLEHDGIFIDSLKAKLSLIEGADGNRSLVVHPVYKNPQSHALLNDKEMQDLITGEKANITKPFIDSEGNKTKMVIEYDNDTKEFVSLDLKKMVIPEMINNELLTPAQRAKLKEGEEIELQDGTRFQNSPTAKNGVRSDRAFLILSVLLDGGMSYLIVNGAKNLLGKGKNEQSTDYSQGYKDAEKKMEEQKHANKNSNFINFSDDHHKRDLDEQARQRKGEGKENKQQETRGYSRSGVSR